MKPTTDPLLHCCCDALPLELSNTALMSLQGLSIALFTCLLIPLRFLTIYFINLKANKDVPDRKKNKKRKEKERKETGEMAPWLEH